MTGKDRCSRCATRDDECVVNPDAIARWREESRTKRFRRNPADTNCRRCVAGKVKCELPATKEMRDALVVPAARVTGGGGSGASSVASSSKRTRTEVVVEMPPRKKARVMPNKMTEGEFWERLLAVLTGMDEKMGEIAESAKAVEKASGMVGKAVQQVAAGVTRIDAALGRIEGLLGKKTESEGSSSEESDDVVRIPIEDATAEGGGVAEMTTELEEGSEEGSEEEE